MQVTVKSVELGLVRYGATYTDSQGLRQVLPSLFTTSQEAVKGMGAVAGAKEVEVFEISFA